MPLKILHLTRVTWDVKMVEQSSFKHICYLFTFSLLLSLGNEQRTICFSWLQVSHFLCWQREMMFALQDTR